MVDRVWHAAQLVTVAALFACGDGGAGSDQDAAPPPDTTVPALDVVATSPADGAIDVPVVADVSATFDAPLSADTVHDDSFFVTTLDEWHVVGSLTVSGSTAVLAPAEPLEFATDYTLTLTREIAAETGEPLRFLYTATFRTERDPAGPPAAPTGVVAEVVDGAIDISWIPSERAQWHNVYWSVEPGVTAATGTKISGLADSLHLTSVTKTTTYYFVVTAENPSWESVESAEVSATVPGVEPPWTVIALDDSGSAGRHSAIATTSDGAVAISYRDDADQTLRMAVNRAGTWELETIDTMSDVDSSLRADAAGALHVAYADSAGTVRYANDETGSWATVIVDAGVFPTDLSLALAGDGTAHLAYCLGPDAAPLRLADDAGGTWSSVTVPWLASQFVAIDLPAGGLVHILSFHPLMEMPDLIELWLTEANAGWGSLPLGSVGSPEPGAEAALAFDSLGTAHFAWHDSGGSVRYAAGTAVAKTLELFVDGPVGMSLAVDAGDMPHVVYELDDGLYYATPATGEWVIERVDGPTTGADNAIAVDAAGVVHISYDDATTASLKYATRAAAP
jgi:hypothetical protein